MLGGTREKLYLKARSVKGSYTNQNNHHKARKVKEEKEGQVRDKRRRRIRQAKSSFLLVHRLTNKNNPDVDNNEMMKQDPRFDHNYRRLSPSSACPPWSRGMDLGQVSKSLALHVLFPVAFLLHRRHNFPVSPGQFVEILL